MKLSSRILLPILAAVFLSAGLVLFLSLQVRQSARRVEEELRRVTETLQNSGTPAPESDQGAASDRALLHLRKGDLAALGGNWEAAEAEYQASVDASGGIPALKKLAQAELQRHEGDRVRATIERLREAGGREEDIVLLRSILLLQSGELQKADDLLHAAADSPQKHYALALLAIIKADSTQAKAELRTVENGWEPVLRTYGKILMSAYDEYALFPKSPEIHLTTLLARALAETQECELALPLLTRVIQERDRYRDAWIIQGYCELTTERTKEALASLEHAYQLDPEKPETQFFLARAYARLGDHGNAVTFLQFTIKNGFKPEREARTLLASEAVATGNSLLAFEQYAAIITGPDADVGAFDQYIGLGLGLGKKDEAYAAGKKVVEKWPDDGKSWELLGIAAAAFDKKDEAKTALTKALQLDPTLESAREKLSKL